MQINFEKNQKKKLKIEEKDKKIIKELIKNPRNTDKQISIDSGLPIKTVNRRRKYLEENNTLGYMTFVNNFPYGTQRFNSMCMYTIFFNYGITTEKLKKKILSKEYNANPVIVKHLVMDYIGEKDGMATYSFIITSRAHEDLVEIVNADIVPEMKSHIGDDPIKRIEEMPIRMFNKTGHNNYLGRRFSGEKIDLSDSEIYIWD